MERILHVRVDGLFRMLLAWLRYREVFRAEWLGNDKPHQMRLFLPFLTGYEWAAKQQPDGGSRLSMREWLVDLAQGGQDDLDLRLHEAWHHGIMDRDDSSDVQGIGSNDLLTRALTTTPEERRRAREDLLNRYDAVVFDGIPAVAPRWLHVTR